MESGNRSLHDRTKIHGIQNIFILLEVTKERFEQLVRSVISAKFTIAILLYRKCKSTCIF